MIDYNIVMGIDIGLTGGISFFDAQTNELLSIYDMPTKSIIKDNKKKNVLDFDRLLFIMEIPKIHKDKAMVVFEGIHAFPGQGVVSIATLLEQKGYIWGLARGLGYDALPVQPKEWQKHFGIIPPKEIQGTSAQKTKILRKVWLKDKSRMVASELFPRFDHWFEAKTSHGRSDATLIAKWYLSTRTS